MAQLNRTGLKLPQHELHSSGPFLQYGILTVLLLVILLVVAVS
jgi:hypothetical protein